MTEIKKLKLNNNKNNQIPTIEAGNVPLEFAKTVFGFKPPKNETKKLEKRHIQHYPIGGEDAIMITNNETCINEKVTGWFESCGDIYIYTDKGDEYDINNSFKILLRPMSDLYRERNGKVDIVELAKIATGVQEWIVKEYKPVIGVMKFKSYPIAYNEEYNIRFNFRDGNFWLYDMTSATNETIVNQYKLWEYLFTHHYDIYGLLDQNLAIDINTIEG